MYSMTGFGSGKSKNDKLESKVEIKSVNHKYLDIYIKAPKEVFPLEEKIRQEISNRINRGRMEVRVEFKFLSEERVKPILNQAIASHYLQDLRKLQELANENNSIVHTLAAMPEVFTIEKEELDVEMLWDSIYKSVQQSLEELIAMKHEEGKALETDILANKHELKRLVDYIETNSRKLFDAAKEKLTDRLKGLLEEYKIEEERLVTEAAIVADKASIDEEIVRLKSHLSQFDQIISEDPPIGRKLDFLVQELNREINTIASKSNDETISQAVVEGKSCIDKIREQIHNLE